MTAPNLPSFLLPSAPGQLSNALGTNTGADKIAVKARYTSARASAELVSGARFTFARLPVGAANSLLASDTYWMGPGATAPPPVPIGGTMSTSSVVYNGRLYIVGVDHPNTIGQKLLFYSTPINGRSLGTWRQETLPPVTPTGTPPAGTMHSIVQAGGYMYYWSYTSATSPYCARINGDGTMGPWVQTSALTASYAVNSAVLVGYSDAFGSYLTLVDLGGALASQGATVSADGTAVWGAGSIFPSANQFHAAMLVIPSGLNDGNATLYAIGGDNPSTNAVSANIAKATLTKGIAGAWSNLATGLPAGRSYGGAVNLNGYVYYLCGTNVVSGNAPGNGAQNSTYSIAVASLGGAWTTQGTNPTARSQVAAIGQSVSGSLVTPGSTGGVPSIILVGGTVAGTSWTTTTEKVNADATTGALGGFNIGTLPATSIGVSDLGTGSAVTLNIDGSVDLTFLYDAVWAQHPNNALANGDIVTVTAQFISSNTGDPSPIASTIFRVGQPPTITNVNPNNLSAPNTGAPPLSFGYNGGVGGGAERSYRIQVLQAGTTVFDSGLKYDNVNSLTSAQVQALLTAGLLQSGVTYTLVITVTSSDGVDSPNTNTATSTTTFTPSLAAAPPVPTGISVTADNTNGLFSIQWTNPAGSTATLNRIYYRASMANVWKLLRDNIPAVVGSQQTVLVMDEIAFLTPYDFAVSAMSATTESALSAPFTSGFEEVAVQPTLYGSTIIQSNDFETGGATTDLFHSIGTEALGTLAAWTIVSGTPTVTSNVLGATGAWQVAGGHTDWADMTLTVRCNIANQVGSNANIFVRRGADNNNTVSVNLSANVNATRLYKTVGGTQTQLGSTVACPAGLFWVVIAVSGVNITVTLYNDNAGAIGTTVLSTTSGALGAGELTNGQIGFSSTNNPNTFGGAFANVCYVTGPCPTGCAPSLNGSSWATAKEPAFCWSNKQAYYGSYSLSIYYAVANSPQSGWLLPLLTATAAPYQVAAVVKVATGAGQGQIAVNGVVGLAYQSASTWTVSGGAWTGVAGGYNLFVGGYNTTAGTTLYFDYATIVQPTVPTNVVFNSLGQALGGFTPTGTLNAWTVFPGMNLPAISGNKVTLGPGLYGMLAGHQDWTDATVTARFDSVASAGVSDAVLHFVDGNNYAMAQIASQSNILAIGEVVGGSYTTVVSVGIPASFGSACWVRFQASGTTYTATLYKDAGGYIGDQITTCSATISDAILASGKAGLRQETGGQTAVAGGNYPGTFLVQSPLPTGWSVSPAAGEPAFAWSKAAPYDGAFSASIFYGGNQGLSLSQLSGPSKWVGPANSLTAGQTATLAAVAKFIGAVGDATANVFDGPTPGATSASAVTSWTAFSGTLTPSGSVASLGVRFSNQGPSGAWGVYFDAVRVVDGTGTFGAKISPDTTALTGYVAMLHLVGNGSANHIGLTLLAPPKFTRIQDTSAAVYFGDIAPRFRFGVDNYREIELKTVLTFAEGTALDAFLNSAYAGNTICYRDIAGNLAYCGVSGIVGRHGGVAAVAGTGRPREQDLYSQDTIVLVEQQFTYAP